MRDRTPVLPAPLTSFIGREKLLADVSAAIAAHRLLTLTGPGGSGKTRLAIEVARAVASGFEDGALWVEFAPISDPALVPQTLASALGVRHQPGRLVQDALAEYLAGRRLLIVLDNCEQVVDAVADLAVALLREAAGVHLLATSRERLTVPGERAWPVPPLGLPPRRARRLDDLLGSDSVRLFLDRAAAVLPGFAIDEQTAEAMAEICIRVDGVPLAIELAAARMNVLTPRQIADRLADAMSLLTTGGRSLPKRQRTLRAAIDWSYHLLAEPERALFRRLSVFAGSFSLEAAEAVCSDDVLSESDVLDLLASLVDKSLVSVVELEGEARYRMLDTVDQYATELLDAEGNADVMLLRHAEFCAGIIERYAPQLRTAHRPRVMPVFDAELDNIRAALDWTRTARGTGALHHRIVNPLWWYWLHRVLWDEGLQRLGAAVQHKQDVEPDLYATTLYGAGMMAWVSGMFLQSRTWLEQCVELRSTMEDRGAYGMAVCALAQPLVDLGEREQALALVREGTPLVREHCDPWDVAAVLTTGYGYVHHVTGDWDEAERAYLEADRLWSEPVDDWARSLARNSLAVISWRRGDLDRAQSWARESLQSLRSVGDRWFASRTLQVLGYMQVQRGCAREGTVLLAASESLRAEVGARLMPFEVPEWARATDSARQELGEELFAAAWSEGAAFDFDASIEHALDSTTGAAPASTRTKRRAVAAQVVAPPRITWSDEDCALSIRAFGPLEVRRDGRLLTNEDWTYAKPRELLFYLMCHEGGRTKEQIGLDLWPDASPARLRSSFHVTVHHLRRALGAAEWVTYEEGRYAFARVRSVACDVDRFEAVLDEAAALRGTDSAEEVTRRAQLLQLAVDLYRGDFLEDAGFGDWMLLHQDRLRRRFADTAIELAKLQHLQQHYDAAASTCRALLARDTLDERAHRLLIEVLADSGRPADALRHHAVLVALFREELGIAPSAETAALVERIGRGS